MPLVALAPPGGSNDLDRYELLFRFAAGGMAEVFVARQRGEGGFLRPVAIKRMLPALAEEPKFVDMFLDEARLAALVQSPYVVPTLDCGKDEEGSPYIVMELVVGLSLSQALRGAAEKRVHVPPPIMAEVIAQTALGLYDAHHARTPTGQPLEIVHRDVSPQNVLVGIDGRARLTDFGVARALERVSRTSTGEVKGKLSYFSPEQAKMEPLDQRSDIFALGVVAWEMLTLERLFSRESPMAAIQAVLYERIPDVREINPDVPEALALAVAKALERDLDQRFQTARELADALRAAVGTTANATTVGAWIEQAGGPRLATFKKRIEQAFGQAKAVEERAIAESPSRAGSGSGAGPGSASGSQSKQSLFHQPTPGSQVVGELGTVPEPPRVEHTPTQVRVATPVSRTGPLALSAPVAPPGEASIAIELSALAPAPALEAAAALPVSESPSIGRAGRPPYAVLAGVGAGLVLAAVATVYYLGGSEPAPAVATRAGAAPPPRAVVVPAPSVAPVPAGLEPTPAAPPEQVEAPPSRVAGTRRTGVAPTSSTPAPPASSAPQVASSPTSEGARGEPERPAREEPERPAREEPAPPVRPQPEATPEPRPEPAHAQPEAAPARPEPEPAPEPEPPPGRLQVGTGARRLRGSTP